MANLGLTQNQKNMLKIGVLGVGHLGKIHLKCIKQVSELQLIGFYDPDDNNANKAVKEYQTHRFDSPEQLIQQADIIDIVTPTTTHFQLAEQAIKQGKHVFIEKPVTHTLEEAKQLTQLLKQYPVKVQVGHVERFNPAYLAIDNMTLNPKFIEAHRLASFNPRGTDVSVVLDLMIHDLDLVLDMVQSEVKSISANGVAIVSNTPDIANARIEFENGAVANITASRMSFKQMRKFRLFQQNAYISIDFLEKKTDVIRLYNDGDPSIPDDAFLMELETNSGKKKIHLAQPEVTPVNSIKMELETFAECIIKDVEPKVSLQDGYKALDVAHQIIEKIKKRNLI